VTHKFESLKYVDYIYIFKKGRIVEEGTLEALKDTPLFHEIEEKYKATSKSEEKKEEIQEVKLPQVEESRLEDTTSAEPIEELTPKEGMSYEENPAKEEIEKLTKEENKALEEKLMLDEDREIGSVGWRVWKSYFNYYGGWLYFIPILISNYLKILFLICLVMIIFISLSTFTNFWLSYWSDSAGDPKHSQSYYLEIYSILSVSYAILCLIRISLIYIQSIRCSRQLHKNMMSKVIRAPVNLFFDRIPSGRILNRLNKDLTVVDSMIASSFASVTIMFFSLLADIAVCLYVGSVWIFPLAIISFIASYKFHRGYLTLNREATRLGKHPSKTFLILFSKHF